MEKLQDYFENEVNKILKSVGLESAYLDIDVFWLWVRLTDNIYFKDYLISKKQGALGPIIAFYLSIKESDLTYYRNICTKIISTYDKEKIFLKRELNNYIKFVSIIIIITQTYFAICNKDPNIKFIDNSFYSDLCRIILRNRVRQSQPKLYCPPRCLLNYNPSEIPLLFL